MYATKALPPAQTGFHLAHISMALSILTSIAAIICVTQMRSEAYLSIHLWRGASPFLNGYWPLTTLLSLVLAAVGYARRRDPVHQIALVLAVLCLIATVIVPPVFAPRIR